MKYLIVGDGRMARHFKHYLSLLGISSLQYTRRSPINLLQGEVVCLAIPDGAIEEFLREHPELIGKKVVHFSGAHFSQTAWGFHPLMTFGSELYDLKVYQSMAFVGEEERPSLREVFPELQNPFFQIPAGEKPLYHALCVMSGNFTTLLWQKFFRELKSRWGISEEAGKVYLNRITQNLLTNPEAALTGPLQRNDNGTIQRNLDSLKEDPYRKIYEGFVQAHQEKSL